MASGKRYTIEEFKNKLFKIKSRNDHRDIGNYTRMLSFH